ncbi:MAG TPA: hypothetical protein VK773_05960 [Acidimicrobiales bacterium]|jgi:hypothetical protein|nr:hypothetical protein [Acidimicrobiales bacterium]
MPTSTETTGRTTASGEDTSDALEAIYDSLRSGEATGEEAIASTLRAFTDVVRAALPVAVSQPVRFVDLAFELAQQTVSLERRFISEILSGLQRVVTEPWFDLDGNPGFEGRNGGGSNHGTRPARRAA